MFQNLAQIYPKFCERTTLYASSADKAVWLSKKIHGDRADYFKPYTVIPDVDTVSVPNFNVDLLGHSYYAQAEALLHDIHDLMRHNEPPRNRQRLKAAKFEDQSFWEQKR